MNTDSQIASPSILIEGDLTEKILAAAFKVQNTLGAGFLEKVYENSLSIDRVGLLMNFGRPKLQYRRLVV